MHTTNAKETFNLSRTERNRLYKSSVVIDCHQLWHNRHLLYCSNDSDYVVLIVLEAVTRYKQILSNLHVGLHDNLVMPVENRNGLYELRPLNTALDEKVGYQIKLIAWQNSVSSSSSSSSSSL